MGDEMTLGDLDAVADPGALGEVLRRLRRRHGRRSASPQLTYRELAAVTGWSVGILTGYFSGKVLPPTDRFDVLVRLLGASTVEQGSLATVRDRVEDGRRGAAPPRTVKPIHRPAELPAGPAAFTGRVAALRALDAWLAADEPTCTLTGAPGVGKSALAVHWAHSVRRRFPDGQLFVNLRGHSHCAPSRPHDALAQMLRSLGVAADQVPDEEGEAAGRLRTVLTDRRVLIVLDDARAADQVRPLLPAAASCRTLVTSRDQLVGLAVAGGVRSVPVDVLTVREAEALLARVLAPARVAAEPGMVTQLAAACAYLPLALRIAAANVAGRPRADLADLLDRLRADRLGALAVRGDPQAAVRAAFELSYRMLPPPARRLFRLLGLVPGPDVALAAVVALAGEPSALVGESLETLTDAHLLTAHADGRYRQHDLLALYARELGMAADPEDERAATTVRLYTWYERGVAGASTVLYPERLRLPDGAEPAPFADRAAALAWLDGESPGLLVAAAEAVERGLPRAAWMLADGLRGYASQCVPSTAWHSLASAAAAAADSAGDRRAAAAALLGLAEVERRLGCYDAAIRVYERAAALSAEVGWSDGQAAALGNLGTVCRYRGRLGEAIEHFRRSSELDQAAGRTGGLATTIGSLGIALRERGDLAGAAEHFTRARDLFRAVGSAGGEAIALDNLGDTYVALGRADEAVPRLEHALTLFRASGRRGNEAGALRGLAAAQAALGRTTLAVALASRALDLSWETVDRQVQLDVLVTAADVLVTAGRLDEARPHYEEALRLAQETGNRYPEAASLTGLAELHLADGATAVARGWADRASAAARACGYGMLHRRAAVVLVAEPAPRRTAMRAVQS